MKKYNNYFIILVVTFILMIPMLFNEYQDLQHDASYHVGNVLAIKEQIELGKGDSLILGKIANNFGYGTRIFYPPLSQTLTAFISYFIEPFNLDVIDAFKIVHFFTILFAGIAMYRCSYKFCKKNSVALLSSIIYITMPYFLSDIYIRCALGESFIFVFMPIIFSGILSLLENDVKQFYPLFIIGYIGGILSHLVMMMYFTILLAVFLLIYYKKIFRKEIISHLVISTVVIIGIVSPFIESIISHKVLGTYVVFQDGAMSNNIGSKALNLDEYFNFFQSSSFQGIKFNFSLFTIIVLLLTLILVKKYDFPQYSKGIIMFGGLAFLLSSRIFPWDIMPYFFRMIQFPWRLLTFVSFTVSLIAPLCINILNKRIYYFLFIIGFVIGGVQGIVFPRENAIDLKKFDYNSGIGWQCEYLPVNTRNNLSYLFSRSQDIIKDDKVFAIEILENNVPDMVFEVTNIKDKSTIEIPRLFYLGYNLTKDGKKIEVYENSNGFLEAEIQENGRYILEHKPTITQSITRVISLLTSIGLIIIYIVKFIGKKKRS